MAKGYWLFHVTVNDPETYKEYIERDAPVFAKYGGRFLARGGAFTALEGSTAHQRHVIIEFDSYETALAYYHSPDYQAAAAFRRRSAIADLVIVKGVE